MRRIALVVMLALAMPPLTFGAGARAYVSATRARSTASLGIATAALTRLHGKATQEALKPFENLASHPPGSLGLSESFPIAEVRVDHLGSFVVPGNDPLALLTDTRRVLYAVRRGETLVSAVEVAEDDELGWRIARLGGRIQVARVLETLRVANASPEDAIVVHVNGLQLVFVGFTRDDVFHLAPLEDLPHHDWSKGQPIPANLIFERLRPDAASFLPRVPS